MTHDTNGPPPAGSDLLARLAALEAAAAHTAEVLSANIRTVEALSLRHYDLMHRLGAVERALARSETRGA